MTEATRKLIDEMQAEGVRGFNQGALETLARWHEDQSRYPVDVAGSDRAILQRARFHANAALDIRAALAEIQTLDDAATEAADNAAGEDL